MKFILALTLFLSAFNPFHPTEFLDPLGACEFQDAKVFWDGDGIIVLFYEGHYYISPYPTHSTNCPCLKSKFN